MTPFENGATAVTTIGAGLTSGALMVARRLIAGRLSLNVEYDLRQSMYTHLQGMSFGARRFSDLAVPIALGIAWAARSVKGRRRWP